MGQQRYTGVARVVSVESEIVEGDEENAIQVEHLMIVHEIVLAFEKESRSSIKRV